MQKKPGFKMGTIRIKKYQEGRKLNFNCHKCNYRNLGERYPYAVQNGITATCGRCGFSHTFRVSDTSDRLLNPSKIGFFESLFAPSNIEAMKAGGDFKGLARALKHRDSGVRTEAAEALRELCNAQPVDSRTVAVIVKPLIDALEDQDGFAPNRAAEALAALDDPEAEDGLAANIFRFRDVEQYSICEKFKERKDVTALVKILKSNSYEARESAARALEEIGDPRAVEPLAIAAVTDGGNYWGDKYPVRTHAAKALAKMNDDRIWAVLSAASASQSEQVRKNVIATLVEMETKDPRAINLISELAQKDPLAEVREAAQKALEKVK